MEITKDWLLKEIETMEKQRNHAHDVAVASQAAADTMRAMVARLEAPEPKETTFADLGLSDPQPLHAE